MVHNGCFLRVAAGARGIIIDGIHDEIWVDRAPRTSEMQAAPLCFDQALATSVEVEEGSQHLSYKSIFWTGLFPCRPTETKLSLMQERQAKLLIVRSG